MTRHIIYIILTILLILFYLSYLEAFAPIQKYVHIPLIIAVLLAVTVNYERGYTFALVAGVTLDLYSSHIFGTYTLAMLAPVIVMYTAFRQLFARKSLYSLILVMATSTVLYHAIVWLVTQVAYWLDWRAYSSAPLAEYLPQVGWQVVVNSVLIVLLYTFLHFVATRFRLRFRMSQRV